MKSELTRTQSTRNTDSSYKVH